jgi:ornithine carbamoyltransferase
MDDHRQARHLLRAADLTPAELESVLHLATRLSADPDALADALRGEALVGVFELPSTRTRLAFAVAAQRLGMTMTPLTAADVQLASGESLVDTARTLSAMAAAIVVRARSHELLEEIASASDVPVVNALSQRHHPCEALVSLLTLRERFGGLSGLKLSFVGAGNNVSNSLLEAGAAAGMSVRIACPPQRRPSEEVVERAAAIAATTGATIDVLDDPREAVADADVVYTDVWTSMGDEPLSDASRHEFVGFQVNRQLMAHARKTAVFLHCLPARRGLEVTAEVLDGPNSLVWQHVANQIPAIQALIYWLLAAPLEGRAAEPVKTLRPRLP